MITYICRYAPAAIIAGFSENAELFNSAAEDLSDADGISHQNMCGFSRALIAAAMEKKVSGLLLTSCCDCIKRAFDIISGYADPDYIYMLDLPRCNTQCAETYYAEELLRFINDYKKFSGRQFDVKKAAAWLKYHKKDGAEPAGRQSIALLGARVSDSLFENLEARSHLPLDDLTCSAGGSTDEMPEDITDAENFSRWYASQLLAQRSCMRMTDCSSRRDILKKGNFSGVIYNTIKFCDFYNYEFADLKDETDMPVTKIETDFTKGSSGQIGTRAEAFMESVAPKDSRTRTGISPAGKYVMGVDSGSTSTDAVIMDEGKNIVAYCIIPTGARASESAEKAVSAVLDSSGLHKKDIAFTVATGYGRSGIDPGDRTVTEITCHARGAYFLDPHVRTIIDIGGQDSKVIALDENGAVKSFLMNDKCAAGTGRFLETMARVLELDMDTMTANGLEWDEDLTISSICTVFAESEVVSLIAENKNAPDIIHGLNKSVASKTVSLVSRIPLKEKVMITGGVARNPGVVKAIEDQLRISLLVSPRAQICGALGAALTARLQIG